MTDVHFARFGAKNNAHSVLESSDPSMTTAAAALWHTDYPPQGDPARIGTITSGYPLGDVYVIQRTVADRTSSRTGMVATTAAFVPVSSIGTVALEPIFDQLETFESSLDGTRPASAFVPSAVHEHAPAAIDVIAQLSRFGRALYSGEGFTDIVGCLWRHLGDTDRVRFVFGTAFHPETISLNLDVAAPLVALSTPAGTLSRWQTWVPQTVVNGGPLGRAALGDHAAATALAADMIGDSMSIDRWPPIVDAQELLQRLTDLSHEELRSLAQLLGMLAPAATKGTRAKVELLSRLAERTPSAGFDDIRGLRGVPWSAMPPPWSLTKFIDIWCNSMLADAEREHELISGIAEISGETADDDEFSQILANRLTSALDVNAAEFTDRICAVAKGADGLQSLAWITSKVPRPAVDGALSTVSPTPTWLPEFAKRKGLPLSHAASVDLTDPVEAWAAHVGVRYRTNTADQLLADRMSDENLIGAALEVDDDRLADRAAQLVASRPSLLSHPDIGDVRVRAIWEAIIASGGDPWTIVSPTEAVNPILELVLSAEPVGELIVESLANSSAADIGFFGDRAAIWDVLQPRPREAMLAATAHGVGRRLVAGDQIPEQQLADAILKHEVLGSIARDDADQAVLLLERLPDATAQHVVTVVDRATFDTRGSKRLGAVIRERRWKRAAEHVADKASSRPDLLAAAQEVQVLFSLVERLRRFAGVSHAIKVIPTGDEWHDALYDLVCRLVPSGPTAEGIWERAGGQAADIPEAPTPRRQWGLALEAVQTGRSGSPSLHALIDVLHADYPNNADLNALRSTLPEN